jgi:hypothetical protein
VVYTRRYRCNGNNDYVTLEKGKIKEEGEGGIMQILRMAKDAEKGSDSEILQERINLYKPSVERREDLAS